MIKWKLIALSKDETEVDIDLLSVDSFTLKETDSIQFQVSVEEGSFPSLGEPYILIGDIPLKMEFKYQADLDRVFYTSEPLGSQSSRYFYNFFGESEVVLLFERDDSIFESVNINVLARAENALLANEMLGFITDNLEDAVSICFSRSKISGNRDANDSFNFTKLDIVEEAVSFIFDNLPIFFKEHKYIWKPEMQFSDRGQPTGPDSVHWVLSNLDRLSPANSIDSNVVYNNRCYKLDILPKENITKESDVYENRVINTFLHYISQFLMEIKDTFINISDINQSSHLDSEYVRFDHTMKKFSDLVLKHKSQEIEKLLLSVEHLRRIFRNKIPSKIVPGIPPKMTSYVAKHYHYRQTFELIKQCNSAPAPNFEGSNVLLGLKNLAIVYETVSLLMLHEAIKNCFNVQHVDQSYQYHDEEISFGGESRDRPFGEVNNLFIYSNDNYYIELYYEPKIYPLSNISKVGDLVDTSNTKATKKYGKHHFSPDFIVKINSKNWSRPITLVLDSKYKDAYTVKTYDVRELTHKYLMNIHQVNEYNTLGISPIQLLLILFPHNYTGNTVKTVADRHCLTGNFPVLPQTTAILLKPTDKSKLDEHLKALISIIDNEYRTKSA